MNNMKNQIIYLIILGFIFGCSSKPTQTDSDTEAEVVTEKPVAKPLAIKPVVEETRVEKPAVETANLDQKLDAALKKKDEAQVQALASELLSLNSKNYKALHALGIVEYKKGRMEAAEILFRRSIKENPNFAPAYSNLALVLLEIGTQAEAIREFKNGLKVNPNDPVIGANLGSLYIKAKDYTKAEFALEIPVKKGVKEVEVLNNYAVALTHRNKLDEAEKIYEQLIKDNPSSRDIMLNYSVFLIDYKQKYKQGLDLLNRLKFVGAPSESRNLIKDLENKAKIGLNK